MVSPWRPTVGNQARTSPRKPRTPTARHRRSVLSETVGGSSTDSIGPTKSAVMVFGPRRSVPSCCVTLGGQELPVVPMCKYLGVVLSPTLTWSSHIKHLLDRGNRLFAQCVSWCRSERLPLHVASSIFMTYVLPSMSWGSEFFCHSEPALRALDRSLRRWGRHLLGWPSGSPSAGVSVDTWMARRSEVVLGPVALTLGSNHVDGWWSRLSAPSCNPPCCFPSAWDVGLSV